MSPTASHSRLINRLLAGNTDIRQGEGQAALAAGLLMFLLLTVIMILRPLREALGMSRGIEHVRLLFLGTLGATICWCRCSVGSFPGFPAGRCWRWRFGSAV